MYERGLSVTVFYLLILNPSAAKRKKKKKKKRFSVLQNACLKRVAAELVTCISLEHNVPGKKKTTTPNPRHITRDFDLENEIRVGLSFPSFNIYESH